ncbi:hypothetical protein A6302_02574 [Methylobrevis pamukkalensis]|uniref:DUF2243 domain-containing protein n=2 Tax=Methylobrevis pamukkalensis TaxID=1439726 RepID=A0A1E3H1S8_9HYPH|nr:hypothetical protein A6302_02574 [Methylobrevis pamukkalensis]
MPMPARILLPVSPLDWKTRVGWLLVGFALSGFFDGILLHQILQWHHLLSGLDEPLGSDLRFQVLADGLFHVLMYVVAIAGGCLLAAAWMSDARGASAGEVLRNGLIGFGAWHVLDAVVSHWLLGLHRIRMDSDMPLVWDVGWLVVFGLLPLLLAARLPRGGGGRGRGVAAAIAGLTFLAGIAAGAAPGAGDRGDTLVVFRAGMTPAAMMDAVAAAQATLKWTEGGGSVWAISDVSWPGLATLYARGALVVSSTPVLAGCLAWTRAEGRA